VSAATNLVGKVVEAAADAVVNIAETAWSVACAAVDAAGKLLSEVKDAAVAVGDTIVSGVDAVANAWDHLDSGIKQWIMMGLSIALSFVPLVGPIVSCVIDGTFSDMISAIGRGDWTTFAMMRVVSSDHFGFHSLESPPTLPRAEKLSKPSMDLPLSGLCTG